MLIKMEVGSSIHFLEILRLFHIILLGDFELEDEFIFVQASDLACMPLNKKSEQRKLPIPRTATEVT